MCPRLKITVSTARSVDEHFTDAYFLLFVYATKKSDLYRTLEQLRAVLRSGR